MYIYIYLLGWGHRRVVGEQRICCTRRKLDFNLTSMTWLIHICVAWSMRPCLQCAHEKSTNEKRACPRGRLNIEENRWWRRQVCAGAYADFFLVWVEGGWGGVGCYLYLNNTQRTGITLIHIDTNQHANGTHTLPSWSWRVSLEHVTPVSHMYTIAHAYMSSTKPARTHLDIVFFLVLFWLFIFALFTSSLTSLHIPFTVAVPVALTILIAFAVSSTPFPLPIPIVPSSTSIDAAMTVINVSSTPVSVSIPVPVTIPVSM